MIMVSPGREATELNTLKPARAASGRRPPRTKFPTRKRESRPLRTGHEKTKNRRRSSRKIDSAGFAIGSARGTGDLRASYSAPRTSWHLRVLNHNDDERNSNDVLRLNVHVPHMGIACESSQRVDNQA